MRLPYTCTFPSIMFIWIFLLCGAFHREAIGAYFPAGRASNEVVEDLQQNVAYYESTGLRIILSAPHGGTFSPTSIPDRDAGCWNNDTAQCVWRHDCGTKDFSRCRAVTVDDLYTQNMTLELRSRLCELFGGQCPAAVLNLLDRSKYDANRDLDEATFGVAEVVAAFDLYQALIDSEKVKMGGVGLFIDIHGHGHKVQRAELGYLVRGNVLDSGSPIDAQTTSIRSLGNRAGVEFDDLLRGNVSFGGFLGLFGFDSVPSPKYRGPGNLTYFNGGYNTRRHGSQRNGSFDAIQIESARSQREPDLRPYYVRALACTIKHYYCKYYNETHSSSRVKTANDTNACVTHVDDDCVPVSSVPKNSCRILQTLCLIFFSYRLVVIVLIM